MASPLTHHFRVRVEAGGLKKPGRVRSRLPSPQVTLGIGTFHLQRHPLATHCQQHREAAAAVKEIRAPAEADALIR